MGRIEVSGRNYAMVASADDFTYRPLTELAHGDLQPAEIGERRGGATAPEGAGNYAPS